MILDLTERSLIQKLSPNRSSLEKESRVEAMRGLINGDNQNLQYLPCPAPQLYLRFAGALRERGGKPPAAKLSAADVSRNGAAPPPPRPPTAPLLGPGPVAPLGS